MFVMGRWNWEDEEGREKAEEEGKEAKGEEGEEASQTEGHAQVGPLQYGDGCRYQKILKNKTVSNYSAEDLNAILGISPITDDSSWR